MREGTQAVSIAPLETCVAPVSCNTTGATIKEVALFPATEAQLMDIVVVHAGRNCSAC